ncbi:MAG TPA: hypothetical protein VNH18_13320 [Bryobacteraceae bacterium]|nr:hypothetical protein [Bryobacteraceae bacterium]
MHQLTLQNRHHRRHPARRVGTPEWCRELKRTALGRAIVTMEKTKLTAADAVHLMKVRRNLLAEFPQRGKATWVDPGHWDRRED